MTDGETVTASGLGRPLDPDSPSNRGVLVVSLAAGAATVGARLLLGADDPIRAGVASASAAFEAWAIGRELDPDELSTANSAMLIAIAARGLGRPSLSATVPILLGTRLAVGTTGMRLQAIDTGTVAAAGGIAATRAAGLPALGVLAAGLARDSGRRRLGHLAPSAAGSGRPRRERLPRRDRPRGGAADPRRPHQLAHGPR